MISFFDMPSKKVKAKQLHRSKATRIICFRFSLSEHPQMLPVIAVCGFLHAKASFECFHWPQRDVQSAFI